MIRWLLLGCGLLYAAIAAMYLGMAATDGPIVLATWGGTVVAIGALCIAAGALTIAASAANGRFRWPLAIHGLALTAMGVLQYGFTRRRIGIVIFAALVLAMSLSIAAVDLAAARRLSAEHRSLEGLVATALAAVSVACSAPLLAMAFHWILVGLGSHLDLVALGSYFAVAAAGVLLASGRAGYVVAAAGTPAD